MRGVPVISSGVEVTLKTSRRFGLAQFKIMANDPTRPMFPNLSCAVLPPKPSCFRGKEAWRSQGEVIGNFIQPPSGHSAWAVLTPLRPVSKPPCRGIGREDKKQHLTLPEYWQDNLLEAL